MSADCICGLGSRSLSFVSRFVRGFSGNAFKYAVSLTAKVGCLLYSMKIVSYQNRDALEDEFAKTS